MQFVMNINSFCSIILIMQICTFASGNIELPDLKLKYKYSFGKGCRSEKGRIFLQAGISVAYCVKECASRSKCLDLSYKRRTHMCELFSDNDDSIQQRKECISISKSDIKIIGGPDTCKACDENKQCVKEGLSDTKCEITECPSPSSVTNGMVLGNIFNIGSKVEFSCNAAYKERDGKTSAACLQTGLWSENAICVEERNLANEDTQASQSSTRTYSTTLLSASLAVDWDLSGLCACTSYDEHGAWWEVDLRVEYPIKRIVVQTKEAAFKVYASQLMGLTLSILVGPSSSTIGYTVCARHEPEAEWHSSMNFTCSEIITGRYVRIEKPYRGPDTCKACDENKQCVKEGLSDTKCEITECPSPSSVTNGMVLGNIFNIGSKVEFSCNAAYKERDGKTSAACLQTGLWSENAICVEERNLANEDTQASQSSTRTYSTTLLSASLAVDWDLSGLCACTSYDEHGAWWEVDLRVEYPIKRIVVQTKEAAFKVYASQLMGLTLSILVGPSSSTIGYTVCARHEPEAEWHSSMNFTCSEIITGRYVRIEKPYRVSNDYLILCDVEVYMW